jgi:hypothetical protein
MKVSGFDWGLRRWLVLQCNQVPMLESDLMPLDSMGKQDSATLAVDHLVLVVVFHVRLLIVFHPFFPALFKRHRVWLWFRWIIHYYSYTASLYAGFKIKFLELVVDETLLGFDPVFILLQVVLDDCLLELVGETFLVSALGRHHRHRGTKRGV